MDQPTKIGEQIKKFLNGYFGNKKYFACIYGSYANGKRNKDSDVDLIVSVESYDNSDFKKIKQFILDIHKENGLKIDNEVPFENKLLINYKDFQSAVNLKAFPKISGRYTVPEVVKSKDFLSSKNIKLRLAFNAITSPHVSFGTDIETYNKLKKEAEKNLFIFAKSRLEKREINKDNIVKSLLFGDNGSEGEMYLGYKDYPKVRTYLINIITNQL